MKAELVTLRHIKRVNELVTNFAIDMIRRGQVHDDSKFNPVELEPLEALQALSDTEGPAPFGSEEYERRKTLLGPMLEHHYAFNSHHPEHFENGIDGMDLGDLVEMFFDWKAASERGEETAMNLSFSASRYKLSPQLLSIFQNTCKSNGFNFK